MPEKSPNLIDPNATPIAEADAKTRPGETEKALNIALPSGRAFTIDEVSKITKAVPAIFVTLAGVVGCGKTTLLAELYEKYCEGEFADHAFLGSETILGFEERAYPARLASGRIKPATERTKAAAEDVFLHLALRSKKNQEPSHLLLYDLSGELYEAVSHSNSALDKNPVIGRSDRFVLLFDGEKLASKETRHRAENEGAVLLRACVEYGAIGRNSKVAVVFTKQDKIKASADPAAAEIFQEGIFARLSKTYAERLGELKKFLIASRPENKLLPGAYGLEELLRWCLDKSVMVSLHITDPRLDIARREIDRFGRSAEQR